MFMEVSFISVSGLSLFIDGSGLILTPESQSTVPGKVEGTGLGSEVVCSTSGGDGVTGVADGVVRDNRGVGLGGGETTFNVGVGVVNPRKPKALGQVTIVIAVTPIRIMPIKPETNKAIHFQMRGLDGSGLKSWFVSNTSQGCSGAIGLGWRIVVSKAVDDS